jgi:maleate isomerase
MARVTPDTIIAAGEAADRPDAEGVFLSCTALPSLGVIAELERRLGKPAITSNQASLWRMLHHAKLAPAPGAPGRLFGVAPMDRAA